MNDRGILQVKIEDLNVSDEFKSQSKLIGIDTIGDVMSIDIDQLKENPHFNYLWYAELLQVLKSNDLLDDFDKKML